LNFNKLLGNPEIKNYNSVILREAVRAIIIVDNKILLIRSNRGDYKFPGGGLEEKENHSGRHSS
jgi:ADP-ribose pyrophosphatase YjhB (NUDIX family)